MTGFLASVRSVREAETALAAGADIIDLKEPARGAMGAVSPATAAAVRGAVDGRVELSATAGDPQEGLGVLTETIRALRTAGIDVIKVPVVSETAPAIAGLVADAAEERINVIPVLICDRCVVLDSIPGLMERGAGGLMLDTLDKSGPSVVARHGLDVIREFVERVHAHGRLAGIAGGLGVADIPGLLTIAPDLLGFRGALCHEDRAGLVDMEASLRIRAAIPRAEHTWQLRGGHHHGLETRT